MRVEPTASEIAAEAVEGGDSMGRVLVPIFPTALELRRLSKPDSLQVNWSVDVAQEVSVSAAKVGEQ